MPSTFHLACLIPLFPLLAFATSLFGPRGRALGQYLFVISCVLALMVLPAAVVALGEGNLPFKFTLTDWFSLGTHSLSLGIYIDPVSAVMLFALALICLMVFIYSKEAMPDDLSAPRFFAIISLLTAGAFGLLVFNNLLLFFIFWEMMDVCAYLLIGFWRERKPAIEASFKPFLVTKVGDLFFLLGLALLYATTGSLVYDEVFSTETLEQLTQTGFLGGSFPMAAAIALLFFCGAVSKSAQFPLHVWLLEAGEAPAPASALIHAAATSAGAFLLIRAFPLFDAAAESLLIADLGITIVTLVGTFTAIFGALVAVTQRDVRRAISFSVIGQLGYVIAALGMGAYVAGVFHLLTSLFFNTLLLLAAGSVVYGMERGHRDSAGDEGFNPSDMFNMGGLSGQQPATFWTFFIGAMALAGLPFLTSGFWSRDAILAQAWAENQVVCWLLAIAASLAAFGAARQVCLIFFGSPRTEAAAHAPESAPSMTTPLVVLAIFAVGLGWIGIPEQFPVLPNWLEALIGAKDAVTDFAAEPMLLGIAFSVGGMLLGFLVYAWSPAQPGEADRLESAMRKLWLGWLYEGVQNHFYVDRLYRWAFAKGSISLAAAFNGFDGALDGLVNGIGWLGQDLAQFSNWFDIRFLDALVNLTGDVSRLAAQAGDWFDAHLDALVNLAGRAGKQLAYASGVLDPQLDRLVSIAMPGTLALVKLSSVMDKGLDIMVDGIGSAVKTSGLWFRPKTGKVQDYLQLAAIAVLVLAVIFLFL